MDIFQMSFAASVLIAAIVIIRAFTLHKLPKKTFLILWGVAALRLLLPFSIPSRFSVYTGLDGLKNLFAQKMAVNNLPIFPDYTVITDVGKGVEADIPVSFVSNIEIIWLSGACVCALFFIIAYVRCRREFKMSLPVEHHAAACWLQEHPLRRSVQIRQTDRINAPLTYGIIHPVILLPKQTDWTDEKRLPYVLAHEYVHIRHFDTLTKLVLTAAVCLHWFNPLVWVMYILANRDIELSCDETVVKTWGESMKSAYALTLIGLEETKGRLAPLINHFGKNAIEERIVAIMKIKKTSLLGIITALVLVVGVTTGFATSKTAVNDSLLKEVAKASAAQSRIIENSLFEVGITIESISPSHSAIIEGMDKNWEGYDIVSEEGHQYLLILRTADKDFTAILDSENNLIYGIVDNGVLPKYFETK